jgi:predicted peroxiredoxin/TusA-related sulfurtransferase
MTSSSNEEQEPSSTTETTPSKITIDVRGTGKKISVYPLVRVAQALKNIPDDGQQNIIELWTDQFTGLRHDIQAWADMAGHELERKIDTEKEEATEYDHYIIRKASGGGVRRNNQESLAIIVSKEALEDLISPLGFALAAATTGMEVSIFFQGPGVRVLRKGFQGRLSGFFAKPFSFLARRGMAKMGHERPATKLKQLHDLGATFYACHPSMEVFGVKEKQLAFEGVILAEYTTFLHAMRGATIQMYP